MSEKESLPGRQGVAKHSATPCARFCKSLTDLGMQNRTVENLFEGLAACRQIVATSLDLTGHRLLLCHNCTNLDTRDCGEYFVDFAITTTYYNTRKNSWYDTAGSSGAKRDRCGILLAAESEWSYDPNDIFDDFYKLTDVKAFFKLMIYSYHRGSLPTILEGCQKILADHLFARTSSESEAWLFIGLPQGTGHQLHVPRWTEHACTLEELPLDFSAAST